MKISDHDTFIEGALCKYGSRRKIEVTVPSFIQAPWLLPGTLRLALMHERLARLVARNLSFAVAESPVELPVMREMMQHHAAREGDPGLPWLRSKLRDIAKMAASARGRVLRSPTPLSLRSPI